MVATVVALVSRGCSSVPFQWPTTDAIPWAKAAEALAPTVKGRVVDCACVSELCSRPMVLVVVDGALHCVLTKHSFPQLAAALDSGENVESLAVKGVCMRV